MGVKIISDSTCDLSQELTDKYNINILPLHIILGDKEYEDGKNIGPEDIYKWSDANKTTPHTSAPSVAETMDFFKKLTEDGSDLLAFCISGQMSSSSNVMKMAVAELEMEDRIYVVDSDNLSTGMGLLVIEAAIMADKGMGAPEIVEEIEKLKPQ
ncbi:MAG: DegV family protein, partial [Butyrivibrio sp.]